MESQTGHREVSTEVPKASREMMLLEGSDTQSQLPQLACQLQLGFGNPFLGGSSGRRKALVMILSSTTTNDSVIETNLSMPGRLTLWTFGLVFLDCFSIFGCHWPFSAPVELTDRTHWPPTSETLTWGPNQKLLGLHRTGLG
jgi:hypothetical protein